MDPVNITFEKNSFLNFIKSISTFIDRVIFDVNDEIIATAFNGDYVYRGNYKFSKISYENEKIEKFKLNIPDIKTFQRFIENIPEENFDLIYHNNQLIYNNSKFKFKYLLLEDGIINECKLNINKALNLYYDISIELNKNDISQLLKMFSLNSGIDGCNKFYFYTNNNNIYCTIGNRNNTNTNTLTFLIKENIECELKDIIITSELFRILNSFNFEQIEFKINKDKFLFLFTTKNNNYTINYIVSGKEN